MVKRVSEDATLETLEAFARSRGGRCLAPNSLGASVKHRWACGRNHEFEASPRLLIEGGYWCPECAPSMENPGGWNYRERAAHDPLLRSFLRDDCD